MNTKTSYQSSKAWRAIAAFCALVMLVLLPTSSLATVKSYRLANKNNTNVTHQWTYEGASPLNDKKGIANGQMWPLGTSPWLEDGYNGVSSKGLRLGGGVNNQGTNGMITVNGNAAGNPNAVFLTTNYAFEIIFRADEANSSSPLIGGVDKLSWLLSARSDDNNRRGYFLFQGQIGTVAGDGSGLGSIIGNSFGNIANGNRVANTLVAGHWYYVAGSYDIDLTTSTTIQTHYIADLTAGETTLTTVGPVTSPAGSLAPYNESVRFGIGTRYDGFGTTSQFNIEQVDLYTSNKMDQAYFQAQLTELLRAPHVVEIAGDLIVDLNIKRGLNLDINPVGGLPDGAYYWTNYGSAGGEFQSLRNPPFQAGRTNPLTYQVSGGSNSVYTVGGQGFESTFTMPTTISGQEGGVGKPYSAEVWFWPNRYRENMDRVLCFGTDPTASAACLIGYGQGRGLEHGGGQGIVPWVGQSAANNQYWYHMVNTYDGTTSILYTNGVEMGRNTINLNIADNRKMLLGSGNQGDPNYNNTVISSIGGFMAARVHTGVLTPQQVLNNYQVGDEIPVVNIILQNLAPTLVDTTSATVNGNLTLTTDPTTTALTVFYGPVDQGSSKVGWAGSITLNPPNNTGAFAVPLTGLTDNTTYYCRILGENDNGEGWSGLRTFTTLQAAPVILNVSSRGQPNAVFVTWDRPMNATAIDFENYELSGPLVFSAVFFQGNTVVKLVTETLEEGTNYVLTVNNAEDLALSIPVLPNTMVPFTHGAGYGFQPAITLKRYTGIGGNAVANLTSAGTYPNTPTDILTRTEMRIPPDALDNYGWWMYGYYVAPETGNYNFHTASDDNSQVWITVGGVRTLVSQETGCCGGPKPTIQTVSLLAGQAYFLEQLGKEGGGGDHGWISVQTPSNLYGYLGDGNNSSPAIQASAFATNRIGSGTPFTTLGPVFFTQEPSDATAVEGTPHTFTAQMDGTPPYSPQWFRNGDLIPGATNLSYTAPAIAANNGALYSLIVTGACNVTNSTNATYTVLSDTTPPTLLSATGQTNRTQVLLRYSEMMEPASATNILNYEISGGVSVLDAVMVGTSNVLLTTSAQTPGATYTVTVNDVRDDSAGHNTILAGSSADFLAFQLVNATFGVALREFYANFTGNLDTYRDSTESFKNTPSNVAFQNNWDWGGCCDTYVVRLSGYIIPPVSGNYTFNVNRDDDARLFVSTDETQANKGNPIVDVGCCGDAPSAPITLEANRAYYMEAWVREGGGGDYLRISWKNGTTIPNFVILSGSSIAYAATAAITENPTNASVADLDPVTFVANGVVTGSGHGPAFQWQRSTDGGTTYSPIVGANSGSYTHTAVFAENGYMYRCVVGADDLVNVSTSAPALLTVTADITPPTLLSAESEAGLTNVLLTFSEGITIGSAQEINNYSIISAAGCDLQVQAAVQISPTRVRLTTALQVPGAHYVVSASAIEDIALNVMVGTNTAAFTGRSLPSGTVIYYSFNDNGNDGSGNNHNLVTASGTPQFGQPGRFGTAMYLDGSSTLRTPSFPTGVPIGNAPYTVAFYTRANGGCGAGGWIGYGQNGSQNLANNFRLNGHTAIWNYWYGNDRGATLPGGANFNDGWHSVVGTWDGTNRKLYLDGQLLDNVPGSGLNVQAQVFEIGRTLNDCNFTGWIDELIVVNRALDQAEITGYHNSGASTLPDTTAPVIACSTNRTEATASPSGTNVTFSTTATDNNGCAAVICVPASGSLFALGTTTVNCHAWDANLNTNTCSFTVTVNVAIPPVPTTVANMSFSGGAFNMSFETVNGLTYYVECANTFDGSVGGEGVVWQTVETISGDGTVKNVSYPQNGDPKRFYRIRTQ